MVRKQTSEASTYRPIRFTSVAIMLPPAVTRALDETVSAGRFDSRSQAVRKACERMLADLERVP